MHSRSVNRRFVYPICVAVDRGGLESLDDDVRVELDQLVLARIRTFQGVGEQEKSDASQTEEEKKVVAKSKKKYFIKLTYQAFCSSRVLILLQ